MGSGSGGGGPRVENGLRSRRHDRSRFANDRTVANRIEQLEAIHPEQGRSVRPRTRDRSSPSPHSKSPANRHISAPSCANIRRRARDRGGTGFGRTRRIAMRSASGGDLVEFAIAHAVHAAIPPLPISRRISYRLPSSCPPCASRLLGTGR